MVLTLAHSADADDVFMWWPISGKIDATNPARVLSPPVLDTGPLQFRAVPEDIQVLNRRAAERADLDITAISYGAYPHVRKRYRLTTCGSSMGRGWGPKVVCRADRTDLSMESLNASARAVRIAVPGLNTSAYLALTMVLGRERIEPVERPFDQIIDTVVRGQADVGVLIHESQLTFEQADLRALCDLGVWFNQRTGLPMPLGANAVRRDLDDRHGPGTLARVATLLHASIRYALDHRAESIEYARTWSPLKDDSSLNRYIDFYVNDLTLDCRPLGARAAEQLLGVPIDWLAPTESEART